jgi:hypothetical protein
VVVEAREPELAPGGALVLPRFLLPHVHMIASWFLDVGGVLGLLLLLPAVGVGLLRVLSLGGTM